MFLFLTKEAPLCFGHIIVYLQSICTTNSSWFSFSVSPAFMYILRILNAC